MWHCLRKKGGSWWVAQPLWYMNRFLMFSSVVINSADIWGNVLLSHHQQRSYLQWPHLNSAKLLFWDLKVNLTALFCFEYAAFPFSATGWNRTNVLKAHCWQRVMSTLVCKTKESTTQCFMGMLPIFIFSFLTLQYKWAQFIFSGCNEAIANPNFKYFSWIPLSILNTVNISEYTPS